MFGHIENGVLAIRQIEHPQQRHGVLRGATVSTHVSIKATPPELRLPFGDVFSGSQFRSAISTACKTMLNDCSR